MLSLIIILLEQVEVDKSLRTKFHQKESIFYLILTNMSRIMFHLFESFYIHDCVWWVGFRATSRICKDQCWFEKLKPIEDDFLLNIVNKSSSPMYGIGNVCMEFTSRKAINLSNVLFSPRIQKKFVSGWCLKSVGYKHVYKSDWYITISYLDKVCFT